MTKLQETQEELKQIVKALNQFTDDYIGQYEYRVEDGYHIPDEMEFMLIEDAIKGLLDEDDFVELISKMKEKQRFIEGLS